jgi:hypothetical protein
MAKYLFQLETLLCVSHRRTLGDNSFDDDIITFGLEIGERQIGPLENFGIWSVVKDGSSLDFRANPREDPSHTPRGSWQIGPIDVADNDLVSVDYAVVNAGYALDNAGENKNSVLQQITGATWAGILAVGAAAVPEAAVALAIMGAFLAIAVLLSTAPPNCDGVVGANKRQFTGAELAQGTDNPTGSFLVSDTSGNVEAPDGCGQSSVVMTFSVTRITQYSLRQFLIEKSALTLGNLWWPGRGLRDYTRSVIPLLYNTPTTSVWQVIESWELLVMSPKLP